MKFILLVIGIILLILVFKSSSENFYVNQAIFNEVEIPTDSDLAKDPYYQKIKNIDFPCACGEGKEMNFNNQCVPPCPTGQSRHINNICYPPCPTGEGPRDANGVCICPINKTRINNICQWNACPVNSTLNTTTGDCSCNTGFQKAPGRTGRNDPCFRKCGLNATMDSNGNCNCNSGYISFQGNCIRDYDCPLNSIKEGSTASCFCPTLPPAVSPMNSSIILPGNVYGPLKELQTASSEFGNFDLGNLFNLPTTCPATCPSGKVISGRLGCKCDTANGFTFEKADGTCVKPEDVCGVGRTMDANGNCGCNVARGTTFEVTPPSGNKYCVVPLTCPNNQIQSRTTGVCECPPGLSFRLNNGTCIAPITCPAQNFRTNALIQSRDTGLCDCNPTAGYNSKRPDGTCCKVAGSRISSMEPGSFNDCCSKSFTCTPSLFGKETPCVMANILANTVCS